MAPLATRGDMAFAIRKHVSPDLGLADYAGSGAFGNMGKGDEVAVSTLDGRGERCKVTRVTPVAESYAEAKYSSK